MTGLFFAVALLAGASCSKKSVRPHNEDVHPHDGNDARPQGRVRGEQLMKGVEILANAAGATGLELSANEEYVAADLRGRWLHDEYGGRADEVPGVIKVLGSDGAVTGSAHGWPLGAPADDGTLLFVEEAPVEYSYQVRVLGGNQTVALKPPDGFWQVKAALRPAGSSCALVVLWSPVKGSDWKIPQQRRERLWLASIDTGTLTVTASKTIEATLPARNGARYGLGIAAGMVGSRPMVAFAELPEPDASSPAWHVRALDCVTLDSKWQVALPVGGGAQAAQPSGGRAAAPTPAPAATATAAQERTLRDVAIGLSGDGKSIVAVHGQAGSIAVDPDRVYVLDAADGSLAAALSGDRRPTEPVHSIAAVSGQPAVALLHLEAVRSGDAARSVTFFGASELTMPGGGFTSLLDVSRASLGDDWDSYQNMGPRAFAVTGDGTLLLAPASFDWLRAHGHGAGLPTGSGEGAKSPEVSGWFHYPLEWHRDARQRVQEHDRWMDAMRR